MSGLVSCSKEKKVTDVYAAAPPRVKNGDSAQGLNAWDLRGRKSLDLADSLDFSEAAPNNVVINSTCRLDGERQFESFAFGGQREVRILQILPEEVLAQDFKAHAIDCSFELKLFNAAGSGHYFNISSVPVTDDSRGGVRVTREPETSPRQERLKTSVAQLDGVRIRFKNTAAASMAVICQDLTSVTLPFEQVLDLVHLNLSSPQLRAQREPETLIRNQLQNCRAVVMQAGQRVDVSPTFQLIFPRPLLPITLVAAPYPQPSPGLEAVAEPVTRGVPTALGVWRISNPDPVNRYVRFPKKGVSVKINLFMGVGTQKQIVNMIYMKPWASAFPVLDPSFSRHEDGDSWTVTLEPGKTLNFELRFQAPNLNCDYYYPSHGLMFNEIGPLELIEVSASNDILTTQSISVNQSVYLTGLDERQILKVPKETNFGRCSWP